MRVYIDFEYNQSTEEKLNVLCLAYKVGKEGETKSISLRSIPKLRDARFKRWVEGLEKKYKAELEFVAHSVEAEASCFISMGVDPMRYKWVDTMLEYKMLLNHSDKYQYGRQLIDGKKVITVRPDIYGNNPDGADHSRPSHSLASACYKMLGVEIDTAHKDQMRDVIISEEEERITKEWDNILEYCRSDVEYLPELLISILTAFNTLGIPRHGRRRKMHLRGRYACLTAIMVRKGYPIDLQAAYLFSKNVPQILDDLKKDINCKVWKSQRLEMFEYPHPKTLPGGRVFTYDSRQGKMRKKELQCWIKEKYPDWPHEPKSDLPSLKEEYVSRYSGARHTYSDGPVDQLFRFVKTKKSLNGFLPAKGKKNFWDSVGSDGRVRPYMNIYGSQSSRSQPSATGFIFLKSAWMRYLVHPPKGKMIVGLDFGSQEFLVAALLSNDVAMIDSYVSGDPYLAFAKLSGQCPKTATRESHGLIRDVNKSSVLGILFRMGAKSLAEKIEKDSGKPFSEAQGQKQIDLFDETYSDFAAYTEKNRWDYKDLGKLSLRDGWTMFGDNPNWRSQVNFPVQGHGAVIMREAVYQCYKRGLNVIFTLHDALYIECDLNDYKSVEILAQCMIEGFSKVVGSGRNAHPKYIGRPAYIRLDGNAWGDGLTKDFKSISVECGGVTHTVPLKVTPRYIDGRSKDDFEKFKKYMSIDSIF